VLLLPQPPDKPILCGMTSEIVARILDATWRCCIVHQGPPGLLLGGLSLWSVYVGEARAKAERPGLPWACLSDSVFRFSRSIKGRMP
jgi:hypothetical protein